MAQINVKASLREIIALVLAVAGLAVYIVTSTTGYLAGTAMNVPPIVLTVVAVAALVVDIALGSRLPAVVRDLCVVGASALLAASIALFVMARVTLAADVYFIPVNYPAAEADALHISIAGVVCYLLADIALIVEAFAASRVERATIVVEPVAA